MNRGSTLVASVRGGVGRANPLGERTTVPVMPLSFNEHPREPRTKAGNLVFSLGFLGIVTAALTVPLMTWRHTHSPGLTIVMLNVVVLSLMLLWIVKFT